MNDRVSQIDKTESNHPIGRLSFKLAIYQSFLSFPVGKVADETIDHLEESFFKEFKRFSVEVRQCNTISSL